MKIALDEAERAQAVGEVPVGAVLVGATGAVLARGHNQPRADLDPTAHAEIKVIRQGAQALGNYRLLETTLYVTLEPCVMCAGAISFARIGRLVYGAADPKGGAIEHGPRFFEQPTCHHHPQITAGLAAEAGAALLTSFFKHRR